MSTGFGGGGGYSDYQLDQYPRDEIVSHVRVILPFGIAGLNGTYLVRTPRGLWNVSANARWIPPKAIEPHLEGYEFVVDNEGWVTEIRQKHAVQHAPKRKIVSVEPDRWGRSWRTELYMSLGGVLRSGRDELGIQEKALLILEPCCVCINKVLDAIAYVGGPAWFPPVTPGDFRFVEVDYLHHAKQIGCFHARGLQMLWWRGPRVFDEGTQESLRALLRSEAFLPLHEELIVTAVRKLEQGDFRGAVIDSICAVESIYLLTSYGGYRSKG